MSQQSKRLAAVLEGRDYRQDEQDTIAQTSDDDNIEDGVKLTEISDIVAKYAVVDTVFEDDQDEDPQDTVRAEHLDEDEEPDEDIFAQSDEPAEPGPLPAGATDTFLPERPKIVFRRPRVNDDLYSNWSDNAHQAIDDMNHSNVHHLTDERAQRDEQPQPEEIIAKHKRSISRSVGLSIGLPVVGGALFALALYVQKDFRPTDMWAWLASSASAPTVADDTPTPNFVQHPAVREQTKTGERLAATAPVPETSSPESGVVRAATVTSADPQETNTTATPTPSVAPSAGQVFMARLTVTDAQGSSLAPIPLSLAVAPASPDQKLRIRISGLPEGARLSSGTDLSNGEWLLHQNELEDLSMSLAPGFTGQITLMAEVIDDATHIQAAPSQTVAINVIPGKMSVQPAAAPPENAPQSFAEQNDLPVPQETGTVVTPEGPTPITPSSSPFAELRVGGLDASQAPAEPKVAALTPPSQTDATAEPAPADTAPSTSALPDNGLIAKGNEFMTNGDIIAARLFYERALKDGDPRAATALGKSYDPVVFEQLRVHGVAPDPNRAAEWYRKGAQGGDNTASSHLQALNDWMKQ